jgi:tetratricopeptide (TPR) repeat protein
LSTDNRKAIASGFQGLGMAHFMQGEFTVSRDDLEQGLKAAGDYVSGKHCFPSMSLSYLAWTHFVLGSTAKAENCAERAIASARCESPHAIATALSNCAYVYQCMGAIDQVYACANELLEQAKKHGELIYLKRGTMTRNWADCMSGRENSSIDAVREHIDLLLAAGEEIEVTYHLGVLADLQIRQQRYADAVTSLDKALEFAGKNQENFYLAELYRLKALVMERAPETRSTGDDANYLAMAHETAQSQKAKGWLDRLAQKSGETVA